MLVSGTALAKGAAFKTGGVTYKVTNPAKKLVSVVKVKASKSGALTLGKVRFAGNSHSIAKTYKVATISKGALKSCTKLTKVTLGSGVKAIGKRAFAKCTKLKLLVVKTKLLTAKRVKGSLKGSNLKRAKIAVGSKKANRKIAKKYRKLFVKRVAGRKLTVSY